VLKAERGGLPYFQYNMTHSLAAEVLDAMLQVVAGEPPVVDGRVHPFVRGRGETFTQAWASFSSWRPIVQLELWAATERKALYATA
jgi:hypothetical protein